MQTLYRVKLGRYRLNRRDILVIEKLLRIYADAYETSHAKKHGGRTTPPAGRRHMKRTYADMHVNFNGERADSVKFLPKRIKRSSNFEIRCDPGMWVRFTPFRTTIGAQFTYATGNEFKVMKEVAKKIESYLIQSRRSVMNVVSLR